MGKKEPKHISFLSMWCNVKSQCSRPVQFPFSSVAGGRTALCSYLGASNPNSSPSNGEKESTRCTVSTSLRVWGCVLGQSKEPKLSCWAPACISLQMCWHKRALTSCAPSRGRMYCSCVVKDRGEMYPRITQQTRVSSLRHSALDSIYKGASDDTAWIRVGLRTHVGSVLHGSSGDARAALPWNGALSCRV